MSWILKAAAAQIEVGTKKKIWVFSFRPMKNGIEAENENGKPFLHSVYLVQSDFWEKIRLSAAYRRFAIMSARMSAWMNKWAQTKAWSRVRSLLQTYPMIAVPVYSKCINCSNVPFWATLSFHSTKCIWLLEFLNIPRRAKS